VMGCVCQLAEQMAKTRLRRQRNQFSADDDEVDADHDQSVSAPVTALW